MTYTQSPGNTSLADLLADISRYCLLDSTDSEIETAATSALTDAEDRINMRNWSWSRATVDITPNVTTNTYVVGATFKAPRGAWLLNSAGSAVATLGWKDPKTFSLEHYERSTSGYPRYYTAFNLRLDGLLTLDYFPSSDFIAHYPTIRVWFWKRLQATGVSGADIPREVESFLRWHAKAVMAATYDPGKYRIAKEESLEAWGKLVYDDRLADFRDIKSGGSDVSSAGGAATGGGTAVPTGNALPASANRGDRFLLLGPPDILYVWMRKSDGSEDWIEQSMAP